ncbi:centrosome-associated zinc finger protein CP190-like isoform X7 [Zootermopsis nevadensis]|uniref:centrosome-associated zinc finger protein CP190-like isoform X7 n=1 Tax=Zootermopsis nevadensis TaxID=136037 RepID=UPI000B8E796A|nr:centrosome-associated zinc finger protein CP190-like isoform X7 [Zootermopsis nevadensis]
MLASSQQFCVKWNSYSSNLQNVFPRLLTSEHFVDITLACEGQMIKCHKVVLSACSTYFENLLIHNPCQHPIIFMKDMKHREVQALVDFMYKGEVNVSQEELNSLLRAAEALQIRGLCGSDHSNVGNQQNSPRQQVGENRLPAVSLPHDTVLSGRESPPFKRRRTVAEEQEQTSKVAPSQNNRASIGSSSSLMEVNNLPVAATPSSHNTFLETDSYSDHVENKKVIKQELDMENCYIEGEVEADGPDEDYGFEHQDDSDSNNREDVLPAPSLDQPGPSGLMSGQGIAALDKATSGMGLSALVHSNVFDQFGIRTTRSYSRSSLLQALMDVKKGESIYSSAKVHGIPRKTLRNWMVRWNIKSSYPMPKQLKVCPTNQKGAKRTKPLVML